MNSTKVMPFVRLNFSPKMAQPTDDDDPWTINYDDLVFEKEIGSGSFSRVYKAEYLGVHVAVKQLFTQIDEEMRIYLIREVEVLKSV